MKSLVKNWKPAAKKLNALLGPLVFSVAGGHFRSAVTSRPVDAFGNALPWYTYPAVDFLSVLDLKQARVAEFGSGQSTVWWAGRAKEVLAIESNPDWFHEVGDKTSRLPNVDLKLVSSPADAQQHLRPGYYDIVIVDDSSGMYPVGRQLNAQAAFQAVKPTGLVIIDNADTGFGEPGAFPIIETANAETWLRVDFFGHVPGAMKRSCTSLFFRPEVEWLSGLRPPTVSQWRRAA
jgi:hypothetical protein